MMAEAGTASLGSPALSFPTQLHPRAVLVCTAYEIVPLDPFAEPLNFTGFTIIGLCFLLQINEASKLRAGKMEVHFGYKNH